MSTARWWCPTISADDIEKALLSARLPSVFVGRPWYLPGPTELRRHRQPARARELATRHLLERGRRRIGTVAGPADMIAAVDRLAGWSAALTDGTGCPPTPSSTATSPRRVARRPPVRLLERHPDLDAIFVANDLMAVGALGVLRAAGRSVPGTWRWSATTTAPLRR